MTSSSPFGVYCKALISIGLTFLLANQISAGPGIDLINTTKINTIHVVDATKESLGCDKYKIRICVLEIVNNETDSAIKVYNHLQENDNYDTLRKIIKQNYAKYPNDLQKLLNFVSKLPECNQRYTAFEILFDTVHWNTQQSFQLAYQLKDFIEGFQACCSKDHSEIKEKLIYLKYKIPDGIQTIVWQQSNLCLRSPRYHEDLYMAECCFYDDQRRRMYSWIPKGEIGPQGAFTFEPIKDAALFRIKSDRYQEHLYAADCCQYDKERRNVFTWIPKGDIGTQGEWTLELVNLSNIFRIRNNHYDEYLYAADCCFRDNDRRSIFTWIPKGDIGIQGEFEIKPCS